MIRLHVVAGPAEVGVEVPAEALANPEQWDRLRQKIKYAFDQYRPPEPVRIEELRPDRWCQVCGAMPFVVVTVGDERSYYCEEHAPHSNRINGRG